MHQRQICTHTGSKGTSVLVCGHKLTKVQSIEECMLNRLTVLKQKDLPEVRKAILCEQEGKCCVCHDDLVVNGREMPGTSLDHQHKRKRGDRNGPDGAGCLRGVLCRGLSVCLSDYLCCLIDP